MKLSKLVEAQKVEAFNKYNAVELMGQLMGLLKRYNLDDAVDAFKKVTPIINKAWQGRDKDASAAVEPVKTARGITPQQKGLLRVLDTDPAATC